VKDPETGKIRAGTVAEADAYALAVNRTADLGIYDDVLLADDRVDQPRCRPDGGHLL
jgi:hypothetical protein